MIQINACDECEVIACIADTRNSQHGICEIRGIFVCHKCLKTKGWHQSMTFESDMESLSPSDPGYVSRLRIVRCPYGRKTKARLDWCVECYSKAQEEICTRLSME